MTGPERDPERGVEQQERRLGLADVIDRRCISALVTVVAEGRAANRHDRHDVVDAADGDDGVNVRKREFFFLDVLFVCRKQRDEVAEGRAIASSNELVCRLWVPPRMAASASTVVRTMLL